MTQTYQLIVLDKDLPPLNFRTAVTLARKWQRHVAICGLAETPAAGIAMIKGGASDIIPATFTKDDIDLLNEKLVMHAVADERVDHYNSRLLDPTEELVGRSAAIRACIEAVQTALAQRRCVVLQGEAGTGKRLVTRQMHQRMLSPSAPYILLEVNQFTADEIDRAYFTANSDGVFACASLAAGGTLVIDDACALTEESIAKLPALLTQLADNDIRLCLITSNTAPKLGELGAVPIVIPPLRERDGDALLIASYLLRRTISDSNKSASLLTEDTREYLCSHQWPLNILELRNWVERLAIAHESGGEMPQASTRPAAAAAVPGASDESSVVFRLGQSLEDVEKEFIRRTYEANDQNRGKTAQVLGISIRTLYTKLLVLEREQKLPVNA